jgi:hypothetical protein
MGHYPRQLRYFIIGKMSYPEQKTGQTLGGSVGEKLYFRVDRIMEIWVNYKRG